MSSDPIHVWWSWGCWLFGFSLSRRETGLCFGPLNVSIIPGLFRQEPDQ